MNVIAPSNCCKSWRQCRVTLTTLDLNCIPCGIRSAAIRVSRRSLTHSRQKTSKKTRANESEEILRRAEAAQCLQSGGRVPGCRLVVIQIATQVFPFLEIPNWVVRLVIALVVTGFPIAAVSAWAFEITPQGIKRTEVADALPLSEHRRQHAWIYVVLICGAVSTALFFLGRYTAGRKTEIANEIVNKSIAVLPFENFSEDKAFAFFADGVQDEILTDLAKIADLKVISRTSVMQYKNTAARNLPEIAQALKVAHVLEGSVQRSANRVRVSAQLIDARNDTHIWAEKYDRDLADVFAIQSEIAQAIADQLQAKLSPKEKSAINERPTSDLAAHDLYLQAKELSTKAKLTPRARERIFFKRCSCLTRPSRAIRHFSWPIVNSLLRTI